jgi:hypothetical protein
MVRDSSTSCHRLDRSRRMDVVQRLRANTILRRVRRLASVSRTSQQSPTRQRGLPAIRIGIVAGITGLLCCVGPTVLALLGVVSAGTAFVWATDLYDGYRWWFRLAGLAVMALLVWVVAQAQPVQPGRGPHRARTALAFGRSVATARSLRGSVGRGERHLGLPADFFIAGDACSPGGTRHARKRPVDRRGAAQPGTHASPQPSVEEKVRVVLSVLHGARCPSPRRARRSARCWPRLRPTGCRQVWNRH